jgi:organic radical activating enzyme
MKTIINWQLNNYCTGGCTYCPSEAWGGEKPESITEFVKIAKQIIDHYTRLGRTIDWIFDGGEPLEFFDLPEVLKLCKEAGGNIELSTNGGKMWLDWWAIEPHVDNLHLTYHYWQNPNLIQFIVQAFKKSNKLIDLKVPIRHDFFDEDMNRAYELEQSQSIEVIKQPLYKSGNSIFGLVDYSKDQLERLFGKVEENNEPVPTTWEEKTIQIVNISPSFTGKLCNVGIEKLNIGAAGWVSGSSCNNSPLGNIWKGTLSLPDSPVPCKMVVCTDESDQKITKF